VALVTRFPDRIRFTPDFRLKVQLNEEESVFEAMRRLSEEFNQDKKKQQLPDTADFSIG
jgi:hypothetical protein